MYVESKGNTKLFIFLLLIILAIISVVVFFLFDGEEKKSNDFENRILADAQKYVEITNVPNDTFIAIADIESIVGTLYNTCNKSSGVQYLNGKFEPYVICSNYVSSFIEEANNKTYDNIILKEDAFLITSDSKYVEYGFISDYKVDVSGIRNFNKQGLYPTDYYVKNSAGEIIEVATRYTLYSAYNDDLDQAKMVLNGDKEIYIKKGTTFTDPFVSLIGAKDNSLLEKVKVSGKVNVNVPGTYTLTYSLYQLSVSRKVIVTTMDYNLYLSNSNYTKDSINIVIEVSSSNFSHIVLPNGQKTTNSTYKYEVSQNGVYSFTIVTKSGEQTTVTKEVTNIDRVGPTVLCSGKAEKGATTIHINALDDSGIKYYKYGDYTSNITEKDYKIDKKVSALWVHVTDNAGNVTDSLCQITVIEDPEEPEQGTEGEEVNPNGNYKKIRLTHFDDAGLATCGQTCVQNKISSGEIKVDEHGWYMYKYNGKWYHVVAAAINDPSLIAKYGHESYTDIKYYNYYDTFKLYISESKTATELDNTYKGYDVIVLDVCGACMKFSKNVQDIHPGWSTATIEKWRSDAIKGNSIKLDLWTTSSPTAKADWAFIEK